MKYRTHFKMPPIVETPRNEHTRIHPAEGRLFNIASTESKLIRTLASRRSTAVSWVAVTGSRYTTAPGGRRESRKSQENAWIQHQEGLCGEQLRYRCWR
jgi:hypothetical protein